MVLVIARMKRERDDVGHHVNREARERYPGERRRERMPVGFLVSAKTAGRCHPVDVGVDIGIFDVGLVCERENFGAVAEEEVRDEPAGACTMTDIVALDKL